MKQFWLTAVVICSLMFFSHQQVFADDETTDENETSAYSNPAQAAHAANLADEVAASDPETKAAANDVKAAEADVADAKETLANTDPDDDAAKAQAAADLAAAESELDKADAALDAKIGEIAGVASDDIAGMRASGMGWGDIAHELGVHPSTLGLGHAKTKGNKKGKGLSDPENEIAEATRRDVEHGWSKGHGEYASKSSSGKKGLGLSETGMARGSKSSNGKSGEKGNSSKSGSGNSSKGNSQGQSSGKGNNGNGGGNSGGGNGGGNGGGKK